MPRTRLVQMALYLAAGVINTAFGFLLYALLIRAGYDRYVAQAIGYVLGTAFNYMTYSRGVFSEAGPAKLRFVLSYAGNYIVNIAALRLASAFVHDPYAAGAICTVFVVLLNYFVLRRFVFRPAAT